MAARNGLSRRARRRYGLAVFCCALLMSGAAGAAISWKRIATVTTETANQLCYTDGTNIICDSNAPTLSGSNVGIGTTNPTAPLQVNGNINATSFNSQLLSNGGLSTALVVGAGASVSSGGANNVAVGYNASASGNNAMAIGGGASSQGDSIAIGPAATVTGNYSTAIGLSASAINASIVLGANASSTSSFQFVAGSDGQPISNIYFGKGVTDATPTAYTINGTGGSGTNISGGGINIQGGVPTGTGTYGPINLQASGGSVGIGTTSPVEKLDVAGTVKVAGTGSEACSASTVGQIRYNPGGQYMEICTYP